MRLTLRRRQILWAYLFLSVTLIFFVAIRWYPTFFALNISFRDWKVMQGTGPWIGFENYMEIIENFGKRRSDVRAAFMNTGKYVLFGVPAQIIISLGVALLLNSIRRFTGFFRAAFFIPFVTSAVAVAFVWNWLYAPLTGLINQTLLMLGLPVQGFLQDPNQALQSITAVAVWSAIGFSIIIFLAGLQQIPDIYYEAAEIDGAGPWRKFWHITIPLLNPVIVYLTVLATIAFLREFVLVRNMSPRGEGGPLNSTISVVLHVYQTGFGSYKMGYAAAVTVVLFLIILAITVLQLRFLSRRVEY